MPEVPKKQPESHARGVEISPDGRHMTGHWILGEYVSPSEVGILAYVLVRLSCYVTEIYREILFFSDSWSRTIIGRNDKPLTQK
jgi:hypothetical protein